MSALPPKADIAERDRHVRFVAILFNPIFPIYLHRGTWFYFDIVAASIRCASGICEVRRHRHTVNIFGQQGTANSQALQQAAGEQRTAPDAQYRRKRARNP
jgi:hypothetical protein